MWYFITCKELSRWYHHLCTILHVAEDGTLRRIHGVGLIGDKEYVERSFKIHKNMFVNISVCATNFFFFLYHKKTCTVYKVVERKRGGGITCNPLLHWLKTKRQSKPSVPRGPSKCERPSGHELILTDAIGGERLNYKKKKT